MKNLIMHNTFSLGYYRRRYDDFGITRLRYIFKPSLPVIAIKLGNGTLIVNLCPEPILSLLHRVTKAA